jgi:hypothetical protein
MKSPQDLYVDFSALLDRQGFQQNVDLNKAERVEFFREIQIDALQTAEVAAVEALQGDCDFEKAEHVIVGAIRSIARKAAS